MGTVLVGSVLVGSVLVGVCLWGVLVVDLNVKTITSLGLPPAVLLKTTPVQQHPPPQMTTGQLGSTHICFRQAEAMVTDGPPRSIIQDLHSTGASTAAITSQSDEVLRLRVIYRVMDSTSCHSHHLITITHTHT